MVFSISASASTLVLQLFTGVLTARLLGPTGRGEIEAVMSWVNLSAIVFAFGFGSGLAYLQAQRETPSPSLLGAGLASVVVLSSVAVVVTQVLIPLGFAEQRSEIVSLARMMMFGIFLVMGTNLVRTIFSSNNFFLATSLSTAGQPFLYAMGAVGLWAADRYSVAGVTSVQLASYGLIFAIGGVQLQRVSGLARPDRAEVRQATTFGLRGYGASLSRLANVRLDVVIMPAFLVADQIGLYVVAVSVGSMMVALFQQLNRVVFTNTVRADPAARMLLIERIARIVVYSATSIAVVLAVFGPLLISIVYGEEFRASATPLRILLPGLVLWTAGIVLSGALVGLDRPGRTSLAQMYGLIVTVVGLSVLLPTMGIEGAALTSTLSYATVAGSNAYFLRRTGGFSLRRSCSPRLFVGDLGVVVDRFRRRT